jgi:hypothetical protein
MARTEAKASDEKIRVDLDSDVGNHQGRSGSVTPRERILFRMSMIRTACAVIGSIFSTVSGLVALYMFWKIFLHAAGH